MAQQHSFAVSRPPAVRPEQRQSPRVDVEVAVDLHSDSNFYTGLIQNISSGGLFIATQVPRSVGDRIRVRFTLPSSQTAIECDAEVRWLREQSSLHRIEGMSGIGVRFLNLSSAAAEVIAQFMRARDPLFFDDD